MQVLTGPPIAGVNDGKQRSRVIDLDVDIGADAVDYKYVPTAAHSVCLLTRNITALLRTRNLCQG